MRPEAPRNLPLYFLKGQWLNIPYFSLCSDLVEHNYVNVKSHLYLKLRLTAVQFSSVAQSCLTICDPMNSSTPQ